MAQTRIGTAVRRSGLATVVAALALGLAGCHRSGGQGARRYEIPGACARAVQVALDALPRLPKGVLRFDPRNVETRRVVIEEDRDTCTVLFYPRDPLESGALGFKVAKGSGVIQGNVVRD